MSVPGAAAMDPGKRDSLEVAEAARETEWTRPSFAAGLFLGRFRPGLAFPFPEPSDEDRRAGDAYLAKIEAFLRSEVDPDAIDRTGEVPARVLSGLARLGAFGMKIPKAYGGLGLSQVNYNRVIELVASWCGSTAVWLSAHQSIGVPQPLKLFGTEAQKRKYLPRLAAGAISGFALTEPGVGSDPARMATTAVPTPEGDAYVIDGEKLWCTNGPVAELLIVMARTPPVVVDGRERKQITAFIVERSWPGIETVSRCDFMGLKGIQNGLLRFTNVRVPKENILWGPGLGLKLALITLNTGRLTLPAACTGMGKQCVRILRRWANERVQWGAPIGRHDAVAGMIASTAAATFAMEAVTAYASALADRGDADIRLEAAMAKLFCSEASWRAIDDTLQVRGGRGYETGPSLRARGEPGPPVERMMRDGRINRIIEGTGEILRLFLAREALDPHLRVAGDVLNPKLGLLRRAKAALRAAAFYAAWYPARWLTLAVPPRHAGLAAPLDGHVRRVHRDSARLARAVFHAMLRHGPGLERRQRLLGRLVDIGVDLFAMTAVCSLACARLRRDPADRTPATLADLFCREARRRVAAAFRGLWCNDDVRAHRVAQEVMEGRMAWMETGVVQTDWEPGVIRSEGGKG